MAEINTIEVAEKPLFDSNTVSLLEKSLRLIGIEDACAFSTQLFSFDGAITEEKLAEASGLVHHHVTQKTFINQPLEMESDWDFAIRVDYKPGVTDNCARVVGKDMELIALQNTGVYTSNIHYVSGEFNSKLKEELERVASNPQIHDITILSRKEFEVQKGFENKIHPVELPDRPNMFPIDLGSMTRKELLKTGSLGTLNLDFVKPSMKEKEIDEELRGGTLSLKEDYLEAIVAYANSDLNTQTGRQVGVLTDVELEMLAQMWSEHCRHSLYNSEIPGISKKGIFDEYIRKPTVEVLEFKPHLGKSIYKDNAGVFSFNEIWDLAFKNETHNSPSALDPFGGSITGIVGVNRDPFGTGLGAEVIHNFLYYFTGHLDDFLKYFKNKNEKDAGGFVLENLLLNPLQVFSGVVDGVEKGANQMGIGLNLGMAHFHDRNNGKPNIGVGSVGRMPKEINGKPTYEKHIDIGDRLYVIGGRAGKDGIHGATFSSEGLTAKSPATAVQIGDPYTQRKMFEALLELRDKGYIKYITDLGAGGICCASFEMAEETGGLDIDLDKLLIKYEGMTATEIFLNESQERMAIAVNDENREDIETILRKHEVEFSDIGIFTDSGRAVVKCKDENVIDMDMKFIHEGFPDRKLNPKEYRKSEEEQAALQEELDQSINEGKVIQLKDYVRNEFYDMLRRPNLASCAYFLDRMDSTVKGLKAQHCIQGKGRVSKRAACVLVDIESPEGLVMAYGHTERQSYIDSEKMGKNAFLRSIGNNIAMGGRLDHMVATDQALWQSSDQGEYQQMLIEANRGMAGVIEGCKIPVISGKDSMYNQAKVYDGEGNTVERGVFPTILMITAAKIDDVDDVVTVATEDKGDIVYVVGATTKADMGGSEFNNMHSEKKGKEYNVGQVSDEDVSDVFDTYEKMNKACNGNLVKSANYIGEGGLATALKETTMAGERGIECWLDFVHQEAELELHELMYSETEGRFLVTVGRDNTKEFEGLFKDKCSRIGNVTNGNLTMDYRGETILTEKVDELLKVYHEVDRAA